jgi:hypothetical protein
VRKLFAVLVAAVAMAVVVGAPTATADPAGYTHWQNARSGLCLGAAGGGTANGTKIIQWTCNPANEDQMWTRNSSGYLLNRKSGKCLAIPNNSALAGTRLILWECGSANPYRKWNQVNLGTGYVTFVNDYTDLAVAVSGGSLANGAAVIQWTINGQLEQQWLSKPYR